VPDDILQLFEGLTKEQAQQLNDRIVPALTQIREKIINPGENTMSDESNNQPIKGFSNEFLQSITQEEMPEFDAALQQLQQTFLTKRQEARLATVRTQYETERNALVAATNGHQSPNFLHELAALRAKYRKMGVKDI